jgi:hypothetical protein
MKESKGALSYEQQVNERKIVPLYKCRPENRAWQQQRVQELGSCPHCENMDLSVIHQHESPAYKGWPYPTLEAVRQAANHGCPCCHPLCRIVDDFGLISDFDRDHPLTRSHLSPALFESQTRLTMVDN